MRETYADLRRRFPRARLTAGRLDDFAAAPGVPNAFGLVGGDANRIDPGRLNELDRRTLKEAFRILRELQSRLAMDYQL